MQVSAAQVRIEDGKILLGLQCHTPVMGFIGEIDPATARVLAMKLNEAVDTVAPPRPQHMRVDPPAAPGA